MVLQVEITTFIYWPIECIPKAWFEWVFQLEIITFVYWAIEHTPIFHL
jgi:hypothetical protein